MCFALYFFFLPFTRFFLIYSISSYAYSFSHQTNIHPAYKKKLTNTSIDSRLSELNSIRDELSTNNLFENSLQNKQYSMSPSLLNNPSLNDINRLRDDFVSQNSKSLNWEDRIMQASKACEAWKSEVDVSNRKVCVNLFWTYLCNMGWYESIISNLNL